MTLVLQEMIYNQCPTCGARVTTITQKSKHCNGHWNESIGFECGCKIDFFPNFMREEVMRVCPRDPNEINKKQKRVIAQKKLEKYVNKLDVDDEFKKNIINSHISE